MSLVQSRQHKVYKTKWSLSCQPTRLPVSHGTLVQERNLHHARHICQGDTPKISAHVTSCADILSRTVVSAEWDHP